jgi:Flp pilus assembly protein TadD
MRTGTIIIAAAVCGSAAFVWSLIAGVARDEAVTSLPRLGSHMATFAQDLPSLEEQVVQNPDAAQAWFQLAQRRSNAGNASAAAEAWRQAAYAASRATPRSGDDPELQFTLAWSSDQAGDRASASAAFAKAAALYEAAAEAARRDDAMLWRNLGWCRDKLGNHDGAATAWRRAAQLQEGPDGDGSLNPNHLYNLACFRALAGDPEGALRALDHCAQAGWRDRLWAEHDEDLDSLHADPRFAEILSKMLPPMLPAPAFLTAPPVGEQQQGAQ